MTTKNEKSHQTDYILKETAHKIYKLLHKEEIVMAFLLYCKCTSKCHYFWNQEFLGIGFLFLRTNSLFLHSNSDARPLISSLKDSKTQHPCFYRSEHINQRADAVAVH